MYTNIYVFDVSEDLSANNIYSPIVSIMAM